MGAFDQSSNKPSNESPKTLPSIGADPYGREYERPSLPSSGSPRDGGRTWLVGVGSFVALVVMLGIGCLIGLGIGYLIFGGESGNSSVEAESSGGVAERPGGDPAVQPLGRPTSAPIPTTTFAPTVVPSTTESTAPPAEPTGRSTPTEDTSTLEARPREGYLAPPFTLVSLEGDEVSLEDFLGQPVLINFWATWCPPCREEMPDIQDAYEEYADEGFVVLGVDVGETASEAEGAQREMGLTFPILLDSDEEVSDIYRVRAFPTSFFVDVNGVIQAKYEGSMSPRDISRFLDEIMP